MAINYEDVGELVDSVVLHQPRRQGRQGRPALLVLGARRRRRSARPRRRRPRQGQRGARGDPQGHRAGEEEPVQDPARRAARSRTRCRVTSAPAQVLLRPASRRYRRHRRRRGARVSRSPGIQDILTKCIGTSNPHNVIHATIDALQQLRSAATRARASCRGKTRLEAGQGEQSHGQEAQRHAGPERHRPARAAEAARSRGSACARCARRVTLPDNLGGARHDPRGLAPGEGRGSGVDRPA